MNFVGNSEIQGTLLPFRVPPHIFIIFLSSFSLSLSIFFFWFWSTFPGSKKKITQLPSTRHMVLCRFFFFSSFFLDVHHPTSPYFPPLDSDPFVRWALPSVRQRSFFSLFLFLCSSTYGNLYQFQKGWWMDGGEKKSSLKICLTVEGSSQWECDVDVPMVFRREKRWVEWWLDFFLRGKSFLEWKVKEKDRCHVSEKNIYLSILEFLILILISKKIIYQFRDWTI